MSQSDAKFEFWQVDVFASRPLRGNPLAVVVGSDRLTETQMATFANWTNLSETTFLLQPTSVLRQANEILRKASAYFAQAELDRPLKR